ncbi:MAG: hypothetical protein KDJ38_14025, partial [Gammaproteobacteria bacterium]|nr:hypothetical protein [Gammaproteobacteria bacterium]
MRFRTVQRFALFCVSLLLAAAVHAQAVTTEMTPGREGVPVEDTARPAVDTEPGGTAISNPVPNDTTREDVLFDGGELSGQA